ncbi:MAG: hypothetical protein WC635_16335 [Bacteriovorax sp.]|jgi:hypothetical protein
MKKIFLLLAVFFVSDIFAYDGIIIVLEAPLLKEPSLNSVVLQTLRKGSRVYVPNEIGNLLSQDEPMPEFIQTYDRVGNIAYIPTRYIKLITHEVSENKMPISYQGADPTDYRLEEPIPSTYPFDDNSYIRASLSYSIANNIKSPYDYDSHFSEQTFPNETGVKLVLSRRVEFDNYDRYYFGFVGAINTTNNETLFLNGNVAQENRSVIKLGPILTFDAYKAEKLRLTIGTGFTYNYHKSLMTVRDGLANSEQRIFSGYSLSPFTNTMLQFVNVFPHTDFIMGADLNLYLPHTQTTKDEITFPQLWGENAPTQIQAGMKPQVAFFLGFQAKY